MRIVEKEDDRIKVDFEKNHAIGNLVRKAVWETGAEAAYDKGHPLDEESILIVEADNPEVALEDAVEQAQTWFEDLEGQIKG